MFASERAFVTSAAAALPSSGDRRTENSASPSSAFAAAMKLFAIS